MTEGMVFDLARNAMMIALEVSLPFLLFSLVTGLVISIFQAVTQINEMTLTFVPKILAVFVAGAIFGPWMLNNLITYIANLFISLPTFAR
ncbi:MAG: flagellar biosynthetic protein FliQ [Proteobacteria bacterium]|jgi:flagellar biosynthetic protein FliQ|nr:flagellar biosynthetic protein FliQ [Pseudomonadota bacterium]NBT93655.1 flagellar biosynthetic protein FliQ [Chloroflexota bacterium]NBQ31229.1 flagellar biosynthetic protein FliQ [Pseudomonadota bacterium]NBQ61716.1 flagellar biosynthetic protein FliQ [Pseudomonadota bacterium]NBT02845.1 flagellar biosynthetic protein FliQ [Pseudomonadota bacterium]